MQSAFFKNLYTVLVPFLDEIFPSLTGSVHLSNILISLKMVKPLPEIRIFPNTGRLEIICY